MFARFAATFSLVFGFAAIASLSACGSGSTVEPLVPANFVSFGDGATDLGQTGQRFTVNDGTVNTWAEQTAITYGRTLTASVTGGLGYARGGARISTGANSLEAQITAHLNKGAIGTNDVLLVDGGATELFALAQSRLSGAIANDTALNAAAKTAGQAMAAQVRRLPAAGARHVVVSNSYNISQSPFATANTITAALSGASREFNDALKIALVDLGNTVLLVDAEAYFSLVYNNGTSYLGASANVTGKACTTPTANTCTLTTLTGGTGSNYNAYMFADDRYFTSNLNRLWGAQVYTKIKARW
jgi:outer membrane lipase/esterase